ncbi:hypothetical protein K501DRAFT_333184 [Backusella circina FSU 941]|nr:hypothetical protein K501DRAFT_333184 [Backusella circina FSU 941]
MILYNGRCRKDRYMERERERVTNNNVSVMARTSRVVRPIGVACLALGGTYYYYKTPTNPNRVPYVPAPFVWSSMPSNIKKRYTSPIQNGAVWNAFSTAVVGGAGTLSKLFLKCNKVTVYNLEGFTSMVESPQRERGIITVSNHKSVWDDPFLWGVLPLKTLFSIDKMRWVLGAADICFTNIFKSYFFAFGQTIPTIRGGTIYQPGMDFAIQKLTKENSGWIHIYPEAKVNQESDKMIRFKWGIARLIMESDNPYVIPIWHKGMEDAKPLYDTPRLFNNDITIIFGEHVDCSDIVQEWKQKKLTDEETRIQITDQLDETNLANFGSDLERDHRKEEDLIDRTFAVMAEVELSRGRIDVVALGKKRKNENYVTLTVDTNFCLSNHYLFCYGKNSTFSVLNVKKWLLTWEYQGIKNVEYYASKVEDKIDVVTGQVNEEVVAVLDPPRNGVHASVIRAVRDARHIDRVIYISCDAKQAIDNFISLCRPQSNRFRGMPFKPSRAVVVDLFPHTDHQELMIEFVRIKEEPVEEESEKAEETPKQANDESA